MHVPQTDIVLRHEGVELVHVALPPGEYTIGRNPEVEIFADTPLISRRHALLTINYDHLLLEDLGSSNGTFINDQPVTEVTRLFPKLLYLRPPVTGADAADVVDKVGAGRIEWPDARIITEKRLPHLPGGRAPDSLAAVIRKAMALDKERRYQRLADLQRELEAYQNGFATSAEKAGVVKQVTLLVKRHKGIFSTAAAAWLVITALVVGFVIKVTASERVANQALANLRGQAPAFAAMAETHIAQLNLPAALGKLDSALQLDPNRAEYHARRGDVLQSLLRFAESAAAYDRAQALGLHTTQLEAARALSTRLSASVPAGKEPAGGEFGALHALLIRKSGTAAGHAFGKPLDRLHDHIGTRSAGLEGLSSGWY